MHQLLDTSRTRPASCCFHSLSCRRKFTVSCSRMYVRYVASKWTDGRIVGTWKTSKVSAFISCRLFLRCLRGLIHFLNEDKSPQILEIQPYRWWRLICTSVNHRCADVRKLSTTVRGLSILFSSATTARGSIARFYKLFPNSSTTYSFKRTLPHTIVYKYNAR